MFVVAVEKVDEGAPDPVIIVRSSWLTPKKQECFWPPCKLTEKFNSALSKIEVPGEEWGLINIKRRLYETDDLVKARMKAREAEIESDLLTDEPPEETSSSLRRSKRRKRQSVPYSPESSDDQDSSSNESSSKLFNIPNPPSASLSGVQINAFPVPSLDQQNFSNTDSSTTQHPQSQLIYTPNISTGNSPSIQHSTDESSCSSIRSFTTHLPQSQAIYTPNIAAGNSPTAQYSSGFKILLRKIENLTEVVEENNKLLHALIVEKKAAEDSPPDSEKYPFILPLKSMQDVKDFEEYLKDSENRKNFVTHLAIIGGVNAEKHVRRILCSVFTNELAQNFNWIGKGEKKALKDTIFPSVIIDAVKRNKRNFSATTICELENTIKQWFRFAKDRSGGREKRRSQNLDNSPKN